MNLIQILPLDLQRIIARYLIPDCPNVYFYRTLFDDVNMYRYHEAYIADRLVFYQDLTQRSYGSLLVWDLGPSVNIDFMTAKQVSSLCNIRSAWDNQRRNFKSILILGLMDAYEQAKAYLIDTCGNRAYDQLRHHLLWDQGDFSDAVMDRLIELGDVELTEELALRRGSLSLLKQYYATGPIHLSNYRLLGGYEPEKGAILAFYLARQETISLAEFRTVWHRVSGTTIKGRYLVPAWHPVDLSILWTKLDINSLTPTKNKREHYLIGLIYDFMEASTVQPAEDRNHLKELIRQTWSWLADSTWIRVARRCLLLLEKHSGSVDMYVLVLEFLLQTRIRNQLFHREWSVLRHLDIYPEIRARLDDRLTSAVARGQLYRVPL